jgi:hypothetical protein
VLELLHIVVLQHTDLLLVSFKEFIVFLENIEAIERSVNSSSTPWIGGQLPSAWALPGGQAGLSDSNRTESFSQSLGQARSVVAQGELTSANSLSSPVSATFAEEGRLSKKLGFSSIEAIGNRLSKADAEMYRSVENLNNLDPTSPNLHAELLSVSLLSAKASISTTLAMKFSSKISENVSTLLKTS